MATNNNQTLLDLPYFELLNQAPVITSATSCTTAVEDGNDKYIYYLNGQNFFRYDVNADTWQVLAISPFAASTGIAMKYTRLRGYHGRIISATSTTVKIPGIRGNRLNGQKIQILSGTGAGQERTITYVNETVHDAGVITSTSTALIGDGTKKWRINQWAGYTVAITYGTGQTTYKKILYNTTTELYIADYNLMAHEPWNNQVFLAVAPYAVPVTTAGAQAHFEILSHDFTVDTPWSVTPDSSSYFTTLSGGIYMISGSGSAPFFFMAYYDVLNDMWQIKSTYQGLIQSQPTDFTLERTGKLGTYYVANTANSVVSATARTIRDEDLTLTPDRFSNYRLIITEGTGRGQDRRIVAHTANTFTIARSWDITPDNTSKYQVWGDFDRIYFAPGAYSGMFAYSPSNDYWMQGQAFDDGITSNITVTKQGLMPFGVATGARIAAGVTAVNPIPTAGGANYSFGDVLTCSVGGTGAQVRVTSISTTGAVLGIELVHVGTATGFTTGVGRATTGGTGTGCTIEITAVGAAALITTSTAHWLVTGDVVAFAGCNEAAWNTSHTILGVPSQLTLCVAVTATLNMAALATQSTTAIVDPSKNWIPNEHIGRLVHISVGGTQQPTAQIRWVLGNSPSQLNVATITAAVTGTSKYVIYDSKVFGIDTFRKEYDKRGWGYANTGTTSTLVDNTKNWNVNQFANTWMTIVAGTGFANGRILVANNTSNTLNFLSAQTFTPDDTTRYELNESWGLSNAGTTTQINEQSAKAWPVNYWAGKRARITAGTNFNQEATISASTSNTVTVSAITAPDATSSYAILGPAPRGVGIALLWNWGQTNENLRGRSLFLPRGSGTTFIDIYDIPTQRWVYGNHFLPQNEGFNLGSSYAYDGADTIYMSRSFTGGVNRILKFDLSNNKVESAMTTTWFQGTVTIGNFMEIVELPDGSIKYVYILQNTGSLLSRAMIF